MPYNTSNDTSTPNSLKQRSTADRKRDKDVDGSSGIRISISYPDSVSDAMKDIKAGRETVKAKTNRKYPKPVKYNSDRMFE